MMSKGLGKIQLIFDKIGVGLCFVVLLGGCRYSGNAAYEALYAYDGVVLGVTTVIDSLNVPWEIAWGPDDQLWFTEQSGRISRFNPETNETKELLLLNDTYQVRT